METAGSGQELEEEEEEEEEAPRARRTLFGPLVNVHTGIALSFSRRRVALKTDNRV